MPAWRSLLMGAAILAGSAAIALPVMASPSTARQTTAKHNHRVAERDAAQLLSRLHLPRGVQPAAQEPAGDGGRLANPPVTDDTPKLVDRHRWWTSDETPSRVLAFVKAHPPENGRYELSGAEGQCAPDTSPPKGCQKTSQYVGFLFPARAGVLGDRWLLIEVTRLQDGSTGIRADAQVQWIIPRPASEKVPRQARVINVVRAVPGHRPSVSRTVTSSSRVRRITQLIDRLPIVQPGVWSCPRERAGVPVVTFTFRHSRAGAALARARARSDVGNSDTSCDGMSFEIRGHSQNALADGGRFLRAVQRLLGVRLTSG